MPITMLLLCIFLYSNPYLVYACNITIISHKPYTVIYTIYNCVHIIVYYISYVY